MSDIYNHYITKYIEGFTNLESHILCLEDNYGILKDMKNVNVYLYPYKIINVINNIVFRTLYEDIKYKKENNYILLFSEDENVNKLLDFVSRSDGKLIHSTSIQNLMQSIEETLKWNDRINEYDITDIKLRFGEIIDYGKDLRKNYLEKKDIDRVMLSSLLDLNATRINDEGDCYLYYRDIKDLYKGIEIFQAKYKTNIKYLLIKVFKEYSILMPDIIKSNSFDQFNAILWISIILNDYNKLSSSNLRMILGEEYFEIIENYDTHLEKLIELANLIEKKDKKYFLEKKDWAEKIISETGIDVFSDEYDYGSLIKDNNVSYIIVVKRIRELLQNYNIAGHKKVYSTKFNDLNELKKLIEENNYYKLDNSTKIIESYRKIVSLIERIEYIEKEEKKLEHINTYDKWQDFYTNHLFDLQYRLSEIRFLDEENLIDKQRYIELDLRLNNILNKYRDAFSRLLGSNFSNWEKQEYGISRPILNSDIDEFINLEGRKNFILVFDGMRYDAWEYIISPYFKETFKNKDVIYNKSFSLLPSITSISRDAIYSKILKEHRKDTAFLTKSESVKNQDEVKEILLEDKNNNIFVFNMFDKDGHKATEDFYIFYDKQRKVFENTITELLSSIPEEADIIIASDHGLMRIDNYFNIKDVEGILNVKSRYLKAQQGVAVNNTIEITDGVGLEEGESYLLSYNNNGYFVGGGERDFYSHGGSSMEEVILPFIIAKGKIIKEISDITNNIIIFEDGFELNVGFSLNDKEKLILETLYNLENQNISTQDIETKLVRVLGSAGMTNSMIKRLIRKLKKVGLNIIEATAAGDVIFYKFKHNELKGEK